MTPPQRLLPLALAILLAPPLAIGNGAPGPEPEWVITGTETCTQERLVVGRDIRIAAGGVLDLQGCVLAIDTPPYNNSYFAAKDEGLTLRVDAGGLLRLHALPGRPAAIERADERYGYTIKAHGDVESIGLPDAPNRISGLEGAHEAQLGTGGFQVRANVTLRHTRFELNHGPSLFVLPGARVDAERIDFVSYGGLMISGAQDLRLDNWTAQARNTPISLSRASVHFSDCRIAGGRMAIYAAFATVALTDCTVASNGTAVLAKDSNITATRVDFTYGTAYDGQFGIGLQRTRENLAAPRLVLEDATLLPRGTRPENTTSAVVAHKATVELRDSHLASSRGAVVNMTFGDLKVSGGRLEGPFGVNATDPFGVDVRGADGPSPLVTVRRNTVVKVIDSSGLGVANATLEMSGAQATTGQDGVAVLSWVLLREDEVPGLVEYGEPRSLSIRDPATGKETQQEVQSDSAYVEVTLARGSAWWPPSPLALGIAVALVAVAAALVIWNKRKAKAGP